jgi:hypothetical protein
MDNCQASCRWLDSESEEWKDGFISYESGKLLDAIEKYMDRKKASIVEITHIQA